MTKEEAENRRVTVLCDALEEVFTGVIDWKSIDSVKLARRMLDNFKERRVVFTCTPPAQEPTP